MSNASRTRMVKLVTLTERVVKVQLVLAAARLLDAADPHVRRRLSFLS